MKNERPNIGHRKNEKTESATFILHMKFRQNKTWQGTIEWVEEKKTLNFRSALELMKIIDSTNEQGYQVNLDGMDVFEESIAE